MWCRASHASDHNMSTTESILPFSAFTKLPVFSRIPQILLTIYRFLLHVVGSILPRQQRQNNNIYLQAAKLLNSLTPVICFPGSNVSKSMSIDLWINAGILTVSAFYSPFKSISPSVHPIPAASKGSRTHKLRNPKPLRTSRAQCHLSTTGRLAPC